SISLGSPTSVDPLVEESLQAAINAGIVVVAASGNCGSGCPSGACGGFRGVMSPGSSGNVIAVGAVSDDKELACFSSGGVVDGIGIKPDLVAPGVDVFSSVLGNGYASMSGTSMAAPHVSGAAALLLSKSPQLSPLEVRNILEGSSLDLGAAGKDIGFGSGLLDLSAAFGFSESVEFSVNFGSELLAGDVQHIVVEVFDDVSVTEVNGTVFGPGNSEFPFKFVQEGGSYTYDFAGTEAAGGYGLKVVVKYRQGVQDDSAPDVPEKEALFSGSFRVMPPFVGFGNVEVFNVSEVQFLSSNLTANVSNLTANVSFSGSSGRDVMVVVQLVSNESGKVAQDFRAVVDAPDVAVPLPSHGYSFDSGAGDVAGSLALSLLGDAHISKIAKSGSGSLLLDGAGDRAVTDSMETVMESGSVGAWVNLTAVAGNYVIFAQSKSGDSDNGVCMNWQGDRLRFFVNDGSELRNATADLPASQMLNRWVHVVGAWENGGNVSLYVNGVRVANNTLGKTVGFSGKAGFSHSIICGSDFPGHIDDASVWIGRSLSEGEAGLLYGSGDAGGKQAAVVTFPLNVPAGNYTLLLISDFGGGSVVNESNITVVDDLAPQISNVYYTAPASPVSPRLVSFDVYEHSPLFNLSVLSYAKDSDEPYLVNYSESILQLSQGNSSVSVAFFDVGRALGSAGISVCDDSGNCAKTGRIALPAGECAGKQLLVVKNTELQTVFEKAASSMDGVCLSSLDAGVSGTPPYEYLAEFDAVIWSAGTDAAGITADDAEALGDYFSERGRLLVEGSDVADALSDSSFLRSALRSAFNSSMAGVGTSSGESQPVGINITRHHFVVRNLDGRLPFDAGRDPFYDAVSPLKGAVELAAWGSGGSAMVAHDRRDEKSLFLPFSIDALGGSSEKLASNAIEWLLQDSGIDINPEQVDFGVQFEGLVKGTVVIESSSPIDGVPAVNVTVDGVPSVASFVGSSGNSMNYSFEADLGVGVHLVGVFANSDFAFLEQDYVNNLIVFKVPVYPSAADLLLGSFSYSYDNSKAAIAVDLPVSNMGGKPASAVVRLYLDGKESFSSLLDFGAGEVKEVGALLPSSKGVHRFKAVIDADGSVSEYNESNNILEDELFICSREKVLVVEDNTAPLRISLNPGSAGSFVDILRRDGYCVVDYLNDEEFSDEFSAPPVEFANSFDAIVWSAGDYSGGILGNDDLVALGNYSVPVLFEGADLASELSEAGLLGFLLGSGFSGDRVAGAGENLKLNEHAVLSGISSLFVGNSSPYPDSLSVSDGFSVAEWSDGSSAIVANKAGGRKYAYYAFSINALPDAERKKLVGSTIGWLLFNTMPEILGIDVTAHVNETEKVLIRAEAFDADGEVFLSVNDSRFVEVPVEECGGVLSCAEGSACIVPEGCAGCFGACHSEEKSVVKKFEWETTYKDAGSYSVNLTASDGTGEVSEILNIVVENLNRPAVFKNDFENLTISENESLEFKIEAYDSDEDKLELEVLMGMRETPQKYYGPGYYHASFEPETGVFRWTPDFDDEGMYVFRIDMLEYYISPFEGLVHRRLFNVTVLNTNRAPVVKLYSIKELQPGSVISMGEGSVRKFTAEGSDADGDKLEYWWLVNSTDAAEGAEFTFDSDYDSSGDYLVSVIASDGMAETAQSIILRVEDTMECKSGEVRSCPLTSGVCSLATETCTSGLWLGCSAEDYGRNYEIIEKTCDGLDNDCNGQSDENRVCNTAPMLQPIGNKTVEIRGGLGGMLSFRVSASDNEADELAYLASGLPDGAIFTSQSGTFFWKIPIVPEKAFYTSLFAVSDGLLSDSEEVNFTIAEGDLPGWPWTLPNPKLDR
ncbi:S8 family serine peptidase, partial [Candidatus Woesearchaeota archaeon]|nr:S8 family serine peptidase [Candidatus Woesearchaeota archaeon]